MNRLLRRSLLLRLGLALSTITTLAFMGMLSSVFIAETGKGDASAINQAGSLRMQSYRIATALLHYQNSSTERFARVEEAEAEFENRLLSPRLTRALSNDPNDSARKTYDHITENWRNQIRPLIEESQRITEGYRQGQLSSSTVAAFQERYLTLVADFVNEIDFLVKLIEDTAEAKIERLRIIQVVTLFLTLAVVFVTMHLMHTDVLIPLRDLLTCAAKARHGDFSARVAHTSDDELGRLGHAFNVMSEDLSRKYADLEARVREKTADLEQSNRSLELLYNTSVLLNTGPLTDSTFRMLLEDISKLVGTGPGTICIVKHDGTRAIRLASTRGAQPGQVELCQPEDCARCFGNGTTHRISLNRGEDALRVVSVPIRETNQQHGVLLIEIPEGVELEEWRYRLLEAVAQNVANALSIAERDAESRRLLLLEERSVIARELHDSLAQSLSYLKIQVARLAAALKKPDSQPTTEMVIEELREGLNSAYRQLRELLTTFRLKIDGNGLSKALEDTVREFTARNNLEIHLNDRLHNAKLTANEEIHVLQVVREAVGNVAKHADARRCDVSLDCDNRGHISVVIEDNGIGIPPKPQRTQHYGLAIMEERAEILGGSVTISKRPEGGTRVELRFTASNQNTEDTTRAEQG